MSVVEQNVVKSSISIILLSYLFENNRIRHFDLTAVLFVIALEIFFVVLRTKKTSLYVFPLQFTHCERKIK